MRAKPVKSDRFRPLSTSIGLAAGLAVVAALTGWWIAPLVATAGVGMLAVVGLSIRKIGGLTIQETKLINYPYFVYIRPDGMNGDSSMLSGLNQVTMNWASPITVDAERAPGAKRIADIRAKIKALQARCVFSEPQFESRLVQTVIEGTGARTGVLDPLGVDLAEGEDSYFILLHNLADNLITGVR